MTLHSPTVGSYGGECFHERGTTVVRSTLQVVGLTPKVASIKRYLAHKKCPSP